MKPTLLTILVFLGVTATASGIASSLPVKVTGRGQAQGRISCWTCSDQLEEKAKRAAREDAGNQCGNHMPPAMSGEFTIEYTHLGLGQAQVTAEATFLCPQW